LKRKLLLLPTGFAVFAEIARRPDELRQGLQGRTKLPPTAGMLFVQPRTGVYRYWMRGVVIPLDIVWLDECLTIVEIYPNAPPGSVEPLGTCLASKYALEIGGGMAGRYGLRVGHVLRVV
jgi:uncharacterized membrane protein (UPF0127 family)